MLARVLTVVEHLFHVVSALCSRERQRLRIDPEVWTEEQAVRHSQVLAQGGEQPVLAEDARLAQVQLPVDPIVLLDLEHCGVRRQGAQREAHGHRPRAHAQVDGAARLDGVEDGAAVEVGELCLLAGACVVVGLQGQHGEERVATAGVHRLDRIHYLFELLPGDLLQPGSLLLLHILSPLCLVVALCKLLAARLPGRETAAFPDTLTKVDLGIRLPLDHLACVHVVGEVHGNVVIVATKDAQVALGELASVVHKVWGVAEETEVDLGEVGLRLHHQLARLVSHGVAAGNVGLPLVGHVFVVVAPCRVRVHLPELLARYLSVHDEQDAFPRGLVVHLLVRSLLVGGGARHQPRRQEHHFQLGVAGSLRPSLRVRELGDGLCLHGDLPVVPHLRKLPLPVLRRQLAIFRWRLSAQVSHPFHAVLGSLNGR
mmetsp:Transcript_52750/g.159945  ORF Transcript_52750/g.159945 Transcript_52750/m.159945 type:complete len:428 (-) Transcript_52750:43-1326(-)